MKNLPALVLLFIGLLFFQPLQTKTANAQSLDRINFYIDVGAAIPTHPVNFTENWNVGYGIGAGASYEIRPLIKLQLYGQFYRFGFDEDEARKSVNVPEAITGIEGNEAEIFTVMLNAVYEYRLPGSSAVTYGSVGAGFFRSVRSDFDVITADETFTINQVSSSSPGVNAAVGIRYALSSGVSLYAEAKFVTSIFVDRRTQYFPFSVGIMF